MQVLSEDPNTTHTGNRQIEVHCLGNDSLDNQVKLPLYCLMKGLTVTKFWDRVPRLDQVSIGTFKDYKDI